MASKTKSIAILNKNQEIKVINSTEVFVNTFSSYEDAVQWLIKHSFYFKQRNSEEEIWTLNSKITTVFV